MIEFYRTQMGHRFFDQTVPEFVAQLKRIADLLERIAKRLESGP